MAEKRRTSFDLAPDAKLRLEKLKLRLQLDDYAGVTEGAIVEVLVKTAKLADLKRHFPKREG